MFLSLVFNLQHLPCVPADLFGNRTTIPLLAPRYPAGRLYSVAANDLWEVPGLYLVYLTNSDCTNLFLPPQDTTHPLFTILPG